MRNRFDAQLLQLNRMLIHMGDLCGIAIENATKALQDGNIQMAYDVMTADAEIDQAAVSDTSSAAAAGGKRSSPDFLCTEDDYGYGAYR